jgi:hypothetical protein
MTAIDGVAAERLTLTSINVMLEQPVAREIALRRGDQIIQLKLAPTPMVIQ